MMTEPVVHDRAEQSYVGIRDQISPGQLGPTIERLLPATFAWLEQHGIAPAGAPFLRYYVIDMSRELDVELGVPVASAVKASGAVQAGALPAGRYASLIYTGVDNAVPANATLIAWVARQNLAMDFSKSEKGEAFFSRLETFLTDPATEPDPKKWQTEVAICLTDR